VQPEDVIIGKLAAWTEGGSRKHESDILQMLIYRALHAPDQPLQQQDIAAQAASLGASTLHLWNTLQRKAEGEVGKRTL
jgi:hypothetical protein